MNPQNAFTFSAVAAIGLALLPGNLSAQQATGVYPLESTSGDTQVRLLGRGAAGYGFSVASRGR
jgi:hypothetical protein